MKDRIRTMRRLRIWTGATAVLAACVLTASCSGDSDELPAGVAQGIRAEMRGSYSGDLTYGLRDETARLVLTGCAAVSDDSLTIALPLDAVADQLDDEAVAGGLRAVGLVRVRAAYRFLKNRQGGINFLLSPVQAEEISVQGREVRLTFSGNYGGGYYDYCIDCRLCVERVSLGGTAVQGFRPVLYHYLGQPLRSGAEE